MRRRPPLSVAQPLARADAHHERTGDWPTRYSGAVIGAPGETWCNVDQALLKGRRGLPGGSSLARLLARERGVRNKQALPPLTERQVLASADAHHRRTGCWPNEKSGRVRGAPGQGWRNIDQALRHGTQGLPRGGTLWLTSTSRRGFPGTCPNE